MGRRTILFVVLVLLGALLGCAWWLLWPSEGEAPAASEQAVADEARSGQETAGPSAEGSPRAARGPAPRARSDRRPGRRRRLMTPDQHRARLREILRRLQTSSSAAAGTGGVASASSPGDEEAKPLTGQYIKDAMKEIIPLFKGCYEDALAEDPAIHGKMVVDFEIVGDPEVGGLVANSRVDAKRSNIKARGLNECISESIYALKLPAPDKGGKVKVSYPFKFRRKKKSGPDAGGR